MNSSFRKLLKPYAVLAIVSFIFIFTSFFLEINYLQIPTAKSYIVLSTNIINLWIGVYFLLIYLLYSFTEEFLLNRSMVYLHIMMSVFGLIGILSMTVFNDIFYESYLVGRNQGSLISEKLLRLMFLLFSIIIFGLSQSIYILNLVLGIKKSKNKKENEGPKIILHP